jgi:hypothetical protein
LTAEFSNLNLVPLRMLYGSDCLDVHLMSTVINLCQVKAMQDELANLECAMEVSYTKIKHLEDLLMESNKKLQTKVCI